MSVFTLDSLPPYNIPHPTVPRKLQGIEVPRIIFSLSTLKKAFMTLRECDSTRESLVDIRVRETRPAIPAQLSADYKLREIGNDYILLYFDRWHGAYFAITEDRVPEVHKPFVTKFLADVRDWHKNNKTITIKTSAIDVINTWFTSFYKKEKEKARWLTGAFNSTRGFHDHLVANGVPSDLIPVISKEASRPFQWTKEERNLSRAARRSLPLQYRFNRIMNGFDNATSSVYINGIVKAERYNKIIWYNQQSSHFECERLPLPVTRNNAKIPRRMVDSYHFGKCVCCGYYTAPRETFVGSSKESSGFVNFYPMYSTWKEAKTQREIEEAKKVVVSKKPNDFFLYPEVTHTTPITYAMNKEFGTYLKGALSKGYVKSNPFSTEPQEIKSPSGGDTKNKKFETPPTFGVLQRGSSIADFIANYYAKTSSEGNPARYFVVCQVCYVEMYGPLSTGLDRNGGARATYLTSFTQSPIKQYSDSPLTYNNKYFFAEGEKMFIDNKGIDRTMYLGVELEVTPSQAFKRMIAILCGSQAPRPTHYSGDTIDAESQTLSAKSCQTYLDIKGKIGIIKSDSSVSGGWELVTNPGTHAWHMNEAWNGFFKEDYQDPKEMALAPSAQLLGWANNGTGHHPVCGIHIHVSKDALTQMQVGRLLEFFEKQHPFIVRVAGRDESRYAMIRAHKIKDGRGLKNIRLAGGFGRDAINLETGKPTIEFRIFQSNVAKVGFLKNINFVHALCCWASVASNKDLSMKSFLEFVNENRSSYKYLHLWLSKKEFYTKDTPNLVRNKPNPEFFIKNIIDLDTNKPKEVKIKNPGYKPYTEVA